VLDQAHHLPIADHPEQIVEQAEPASKKNKAPQLKGFFWGRHSNTKPSFQEGRPVSRPIRKNLISAFARAAWPDPILKQPYYLRASAFWWTRTPLSATYTSKRLLGFLYPLSRGHPKLRSIPAPIC
jgi:hypothetical protein